MQTTISFTLLKYSKGKVSIATNDNIEKPEWQKKLQNQHSTNNGWLLLFRGFSDIWVPDGTNGHQDKWVRVREIIVRDPFVLESFRISTLNDVSKSNTEGKKRANNRYQNAESRLESYFRFPYQHVKNFFFNFFSLENVILFFHTFKTSLGPCIKRKFQKKGGMVQCLLSKYTLLPRSVRLGAFTLFFFRNFCYRPGCCNHVYSCILLTALLLPACHNVNRFVASSLFLCRVIFPCSYRILLLC